MQIDSVNLNLQREAMSLFMQPDAIIVNKKSRIFEPFLGQDIDESPYIKIVNFGTGTGKTYGALDRNIKHQVSQIKNKNIADGGFTNGVFITPTKNQIKFSKNHLRIMKENQITPLSILGAQDLQNKDTLLWGGGEVTLLSKLEGYLEVIRSISTVLYDKNQSDTTPCSWQSAHIRVLKNIILALIKSFKIISEIDREMNTISKSDINYEALDKQRKRQAAHHSLLMSELSLSTLNNQTKRKKVTEAEINSDDEQDIFSDKDIVPINSTFNDKNSVKKTEINERYPIKENEVYNVIFAVALGKASFDEPLITTVRGCGDWVVLLATLKSDILRVFAPLNYAAYNPSLLCMTSNKYRMQPTMYRPTYNRSEEGTYWTHDSAEDDSGNFAELFGGKYSHNKPLLQVRGAEQRLNVLQQSIFRMRAIETELVGSRLVEVDKRTLYQKNDINFWIMIDEATEFYSKEFYGDDSSMGRSGVIKSIFPKASITDIFSSVQRKMRELLDSKSKREVSCYQQSFEFYKRMCEYLDNYCEVDTERVFNVYLKEFQPPNILYIDNTEADSVISIVKNAFSVQAKNFFDKQALQSIYICEKGKQRYLSVTRQSDNDMNLHEMYQIILSIIYATIFFVESDDFLTDPDNLDSKKLTKNQARKEFAIDLGYVKNGSFNKDETLDRQNASFAQLIASEEKTLNRHKEFLKFKPMANESDIEIDEWFAYVQTKMVFTLEPGASIAFEQSPSIEQQQRTYVSIQINLITHHPELEVLKTAVDTNNMVYLMSATGGKITTCAEQFDIEFLHEYGTPLGVKVITPRYDKKNDIDYPKKSKEIQDLRRSNRDVDVVDYNSMDDLFKLLPPPEISQDITSNPSARRPSSVSIYRSHHDALINSLNNSNKNYYKSGKSAAFIETASATYEHYRLMVFSILMAAATQRSTLSLSLSADTVKIVRASLEKCCSASFNKKLLKKAITDGKDVVVFTHSIFGRIELPLLNLWLKKSAKQTMKNGITNRSSAETIAYLCIQAERRIKSEFGYLVDLKDYIPSLNVNSNAIMRLGMYDADIDKVNPDFKSMFVKSVVNENGVDRPLFTCILSYFAIAGLGLNNTVNNEISGFEEDMENLFLASGPFYSKINEADKSKEGGAYRFGFNTLNKIHNILIRQRQIAKDKNKIVTVASFDATVASKESYDSLMFEHTILKYDLLRQFAGRVERADCPTGFISKIFIPKEALCDHAKAAHLLYKFNEKGRPTQNHSDYAFMSMNSMLILARGQEIISSEKLSVENRERLEIDTEGCVGELTEFCNYHMMAVTEAARNGDDDAVVFSGIYHEPCILTDTQLWVDSLKASAWIQKQVEVKELCSIIDSMIVDISKYTDNSKIPVYQTSKGGLTDFYGQTDTDREYDPVRISLPNLGNKYHYKKGRKDSGKISRMEKIVAYNNDIGDEKSHLYERLHGKKRDNIILHPALMHVALGNMGERLFEKFITEYQGGYVGNNQAEIIDRFGYRFFEMFDFWFNVNGTWVCIDTKNHGHNEHIMRTKRIYDRADAKLKELKSYALDRDGSKDDWFSDSNIMHVVYVNMRVKEGTINPETKEKLMVKGKELTIHSHHLNFFQSVRWIAERYRYASKENHKKRQWQLTINHKLFDLLNIESDSAFESSFGSEATPNQQVDSESEVAIWRRESIGKKRNIDVDVDNKNGER